MIIKLGYDAGDRCPLLSANFQEVHNGRTEYHLRNRSDSDFGWRHRSGFHAGMSALTGGQSEAVGRNYGRTRDAMLVKGTKVLTAVLFVLTIVISIVDKFAA